MGYCVVMGFNKFSGQCHVGTIFIGISGKESLYGTIDHVARFVLSDMKP